MSGSVGNHSTNILPAQDPMFVPPRGEGRVTHAPGSGPGVLPPDGGVPDRVAADARPPVPAAAGSPQAPQAEPPAADGSAAAGPVVARASVPGVDPVRDLVAAASAALTAPALVVLTGPPGAGRTSALRRLAATFRGPVFAGGGLAMLRGVAGLPLARAVRARLPVHDVALLAEAVRSRVRGGLLLLDDLQWADPQTVAALPAIAEHCRIAVSLRTPHRLPPEAEQAL